MFLMTHVSRWPLNNTDPKLYLNRGIRSIFFALKPDSSTSFPIGQLTYVLEREKAKTLIKIEFDEDRIIAALKNSQNIKDRVRNFQLYWNSSDLDPDKNSFGNKSSNNEETMLFTFLFIKYFDLIIVFFIDSISILWARLG